MLSCTVLAALPGAGAGAQAQDVVYKIGASVGLTGYAAANDRFWRDGLNVAAEVINAKGGLLGKKIEIVAEDNRSEPQAAVVGYRKMISSDNVKIFASGCVSAGNFAAAASVVRAQIPMVLCSILPRQPEEQKWAFSTLAPPRFEVEVRYQYLERKTADPQDRHPARPDALCPLTKDIGAKIAADFGLDVVATETYKRMTPTSAQIRPHQCGGRRRHRQDGPGRLDRDGGEEHQQLGLTNCRCSSIDDVRCSRSNAEAAASASSMWRRECSCPTR